VRTGGSTPFARLSGAALLVLASAAAAAAIAFTAWHLLPYELLERNSPSQRFHLWEATMWMGGMALALFGLAAWFGSTDLYGRTADPHSPHSTAHVRRRMLDGIRGRHLFADLEFLPWFMTACGIALVAIAAAARATLATVPVP
jgi:hypothetical protein